MKPPKPIKPAPKAPGAKPPGGGPPSWAPAYGYRRKAAAGANPPTTASTTSSDPTKVKGPKPGKAAMAKGPKSLPAKAKAYGARAIGGSAITPKSMPSKGK